MNNSNGNPSLEKLRQVLARFIDLENDSTKETPERIYKMWRHELFSGLFENPPKMTTFEAPSNAMVTEVGITVRSTCEHHFQPIFGRAHIAYIPDKLILGLSKLNRAVDYFARRPQVQERLTTDISSFLMANLGTKNVAVVIDAEHFCVKMRGIKHENCVTRTTSLNGKFKADNLVRQEFFQAIPRINI